MDTQSTVDVVEDGSHLENETIQSGVDIVKSNDHNAIIEVTTPLEEVPHGDSFFGNFLSDSQHVVLLKERGLDFKNSYEEDRFLRLLNTVGYYKLSQYFKHFYTSPKTKIFVAGTSSKQILTAHRQNERLRSLFIDSLLKIESRMKTLITEKMIQEKNDIYWCFLPEFAELELPKKALAKNQNGLYTAQSTQIFFEHYPSHTHDRLPAWVVMQSQSFGTLCQLLRHQAMPKRLLKKSIASEWMPERVNYTSVYKVFDAMRHLRNLSVHHGKLLGESIRIAPPPWNGLDSKMVHRLDNFLFWIEQLLKPVTPRDSFSKEMKEIIDIVNRDCPETMHIKFYKPLTVCE
ncbi:MAG: Abi family protein [Candidatus Melainabacteria bacterium]|nr:Abi family protein [Candidatus Melainabacteria bacterium]